MRELLEGGFARGTINDVTLSAIIDHYRYNGGSTISQDPLVTEMKREITLNTSPAKRRQPLTDTQLEQLSCLHAPDEVFTHTRDMTAFTMARKAMMRPSELPALPSSAHVL